MMVLVLGLVAQVPLMMYAACVKNESIRRAAGRIRPTDAGLFVALSRCSDPWKRSRRSNDFLTCSGVEERRKR